MDDGGKGDEKIIAIPYSEPTYMGYTDVKELPKHIFEELKHFFSVYKQLESKKTDVKEIGGPISCSCNRKGNGKLQEKVLHSMQCMKVV